MNGQRAALDRGDRVVAVSRSAIAFDDLVKELGDPGIGKKPPSGTWINYTR